MIPRKQPRHPAKEVYSGQALNHNMDFTKLTQGFFGGFDCFAGRVDDVSLLHRVILSSKPFLFCF